MNINLIVRKIASIANYPDVAEVHLTWKDHARSSIDSPIIRPEISVIKKT